MKLLIGLGNPGKKYQNNRHNVGHMFVNKINESSDPIKAIKAVKTDCFMNSSGMFVKKQLYFYKIKPEDLYIVHDDLDIPLGQYKIQFGVGPKVHNGVNNIEDVLGTKDFWRIRIGIDNRNGPDGHRETGEDYVLQDFTNEELEILKQVQDDIIADLCKN